MDYPRLGLIRQIFADERERIGKESRHGGIDRARRAMGGNRLPCHGTGTEPCARERAMENAAVLKKQYEEIPGSLDYFRELLRSPYTEEKFIRLRLGEQFTQEMFF